MCFKRFTHVFGHILKIENLLEKSPKKVNS